MKERPRTAPKGPDWFLGETGGVPWLSVRDIIVPTAFDSTNRLSVDLCGTWDLILDPEEALRYGAWGPATWEKTTVPGVINAAGSGRVDHLGPAWYRRVFEASAAPAGAEHVLVFEGALLRGQVWLNGAIIGDFEGGFSPVRLRAKGLRPGANELVVRLDNRLGADSLPPRIMDDHHPGWHPYCGIYRPCRVEYQPRVSIQKVTVARLDGGGVGLDVVVVSWAGSKPKELTATIVQPGSAPGEAELRIVVPFSGRVDGPGPGGAVLSVFRGAAMGRLAAWTPDNPRTILVEVAVESEDGKVDSISLTSGVRSFIVDGESLLLEGKPIFLKGICKHEDHPELGPVQTEELMDGDLGLVKGLGANWIRLAHYPHDVRELAKARDLGIMVSEEIPLYQAGVGFTAWFQEKRPLREFPLALFGLRQLRRKAFRSNAERQLLEMIERDRNNPAVIFWGVGNESYTLGARAGRYFAGLADLARRFDPTRPVSNVELTYHIPALDSMKRGWNGMDILCLNSYFGWYYGSTSELPGFLDELHRRWPGKPLLLSEFGFDAALGRSDADGQWKAERVAAGKTYSEEYQARTLAEYCRIALERPWIRGLSPWVLTDFYNTWFPNNPVPNYNQKGLCSRYREPKAAYSTLKDIYREV